MKVVCIDTSMDDDIIEGCFLTLGKVYEVFELDVKYPDIIPKFYGLDDDDTYGYYFQSRFISLKKQRKEKLKKCGNC